MKQPYRWLRNAVVVIALCLFAASQVDARPVWKLDTASLANAVKRALIGKRGRPLDVARIVADPDPSIARGFNKLIAAAGVTPGAAKFKGIPSGIAQGVNLLIGRHGDAHTKEFLREVDRLYDWAKNADDALIAAGRRADAVNVEMLGKMSKNFASDNLNHWKGAMFEIRLTSFYASTHPPLLRRLQPAAPPAHLQFRDAGIEHNGVRAYVEAKNWVGQATGSTQSIDRAATKLADQVDSHFARLKQTPDLVGFPPSGSNPRIPPGLKLVYDFNEVLPPKWEKAIKDKAVQSLQEHFKQFGIDEATAKNWVNQHLHFRVCAGVPLTCR